jgi:hypothetical protein
MVNGCKYMLTGMQKRHNVPAHEQTDSMDEVAEAKPAIGGKAIRHYAIPFIAHPSW